MAGDATAREREHDRGGAAHDLSLLPLGEYRPCPRPAPRQHAWARQGVAVPVLFRCLDQVDDLDLLVEQATAALRALGAHALEGCVAAYATTTRSAFRDRLAGVMSQWGLHDERIYTVLLDTLQRTSELGANYLVDYGDIRALDVLAQTFDTLPIREGVNPLANHVFIALRCAIEALGGVLTAAQQHKFDHADTPRHPWHRPVQRHGPGIVGVRSLVVCDAEATAGAVTAGPRPSGRCRRGLVTRH